MTAYLLLAAIAWAVGTRGGSDLRDLLVILLLTGAAAVTSRVRPPRSHGLVVAVAALLAWLVVQGPVREGLSLETVRVPLLVVVVVLTVLATSGLDASQRDVLTGGLVVLGCLHATVVLGRLAVAVAEQLPYPSRPASMLGSATALGMLLVATSVLTAREAHLRGGWVPGAALALQGAAVVATGSRTAILLGAALAVGYAAGRPSVVLRVAAAAGVVAGGAMVVWRIATEPVEQRPHLWAEAVRRIAENPVAGEGPTPGAFTVSAPDARVTTHAHDELLQWGVEYGLVGAALGVLVLVLAVRRGSWRGGDRWLQVAAASVLAAGLVDFTLRITAMTLVAAALAALAATGSRRRPDHASGVLWGRSHAVQRSIAT